MSLLHIPGTSAIIAWVGLESAGSGITSGATNTAGTHIVWIDSNHTVDIQLAGADTILVHNSTGSSITRAGNVTLVW